MVSLKALIRRRSVVGAYRGCVRRCERELGTLPSLAGPGGSVRPAIAGRVLSWMTQVRRIPAVSGLDDDAALRRRLEPFERSFEDLAERARRVIAEGGGSEGVREPGRGHPPSGGGNQALDL